MTDFLAAVKTARKQAETPKPALTAVSSQPVRKPDEKKDSTVGITNGVDAYMYGSINDAVIPEQALQVLKSQPDANDLIRILERVRHGFPNSGFQIQAPGPLQAQIINALISSIVPTFWAVLDSDDRELLVDCLRNVAGAAAVVARLRLLCEQASTGKAEELRVVVAVAHALFKGDEFCFTIWTELPYLPPKAAQVPSDTKRQLAWKEFVGLMASGKLTATIAQSEDALKMNDRPSKASWLSNGADYAAWLGRNAAHFLARTVDGRDVISGTNAANTQLFARGYSLGYPVPLVRGLLTAIVAHNSHAQDTAKAFPLFVKLLLSHSRRQLLESALRWLSTLVDDDRQPAKHGVGESTTVSAIAALIFLIINADGTMSEQLLSFLKDPVVSSSVSFIIRRAGVATLAKCAPDELQGLLETMMSTFGDHLFINHAPTIQQESLAQLILCCASYLHRSTPMAVLMTARSSSHTQGVSSRLDSTNQKARWLGMIVATALSGLVDKAGSKMNFGTDDMQSGEAKWYQELVKVNDSVSTLPEFEKLLVPKTGVMKRKQRVTEKPTSRELPVLGGKQTFGPPRPPQPVQTEVIGEQVTEIFDEEEDEEEEGNLKPYAKPDSDPEDSDEDATLVNRNKARPPVYIRDLMRMLKDDKDHDRFEMAVKHAPTLIRRKTNFGGEVRDHAEELALILCDLQDPFDTEDFDELKLQALIAVLLSDVKALGPWLSKQAFVGDYGLGQRCIMLSALGLGGRELAGCKDQDELNPVLPSSTTAFPSKRLPSRLHAIYSPTDNSVKRLHAAGENMQHQLIKPLALSAADATTSHLNAVKVRTFSSRLDKERTKRKPAPNELAKIFGICFFFPLTTRYQQEIAAYGAGSVFKSAPFVLATFLKTLALLLHASGPATADLPDITTSFWDLILSLRIQAISDISVLEAVLFALLTLLEVNGNSSEQLARENAPQLMQTQQWVEIVFERVGGGVMNVEGSVDETRVRTLAAGVLVKIRGVVEERQQMMVGGMMG